MTLTNFQNHKTTTIAFATDVTTLVGSSGTGKSSIHRGLRWLCLNQSPKGIYLGRYGKAPYVSIKLGFDGHVAIRKRGKRQGNLYVLNGREMRSFKTEVPIPLSRLLNIGEINFQGQLDPPFWFTLPAPEVSRRLNAIINLDAIDRSLHRAAVAVRSSKGAVKATKVRLRAAVRSKQSLAWVPQCTKDLVDIEQLATERSEAATDAAELANLIQGLHRVDLQQRTAARLVTFAGTAQSLATNLYNHGRRTASLASMVNELRRLRAAGNIQIPDIDPAQKASFEFEAAKVKRREVATLWLGMSSLDHELCELNKKIETLERTISSQTKGRCPFCGQKMKNPSALTSATYTSATGRPPHGPNPCPSGSKPNDDTSDSLENYIRHSLKSPSSARGTSSTNGNRPRN